MHKLVSFEVGGLLVVVAAMVFACSNHENEPESNTTTEHNNEIGVRNAHVNPVARVDTGD